MPAADFTPYYQPSGTGADGTKFDNALAYLQSIINGIDQNNFAAGKILDPAKLQQSGASVGEALIWNGTDWDNAKPPGYEWGTTAWSGTTNITGTTSGAPTTVVTAPAITFDGAPVIVEFQAAWYKIGTTSINVGLYLDGTYQGRLGFAQAAFTPAGLSAARVTPSAGSHTYSVRAFVDAGTGEVGADASLPGFIRVTKV